MPETSLPPCPRSAGQPDRQQWADVAKGVCIVLVVLWHVTRKDYLALPWDVGVPVTGAWGQASELLLPVRMPLFFLISGLFAARQLDRPWPEVWRRRVAPLLYLFVLWTLLHTLVLQATPGFDTAIADGPGALLAQLTVTPGNLWYLLALALYVAVARATRSVPHRAPGKYWSIQAAPDAAQAARWRRCRPAERRPVCPAARRLASPPPGRRWHPPASISPSLTAALLLSAVASAGLVPTPGNRAGLLMNLVWFLLGTQAARVRAPGRLARARPRVVVAAVAAFVVVALLWQVLDADAWFGVRPSLGLLGILAGVAVAGVLARTPAGSGLAAIGRRTLPVYVLHLPLVALVHLGSTRLVAEDGGAAASLLLATLYPLLVTAAVVAACLGLQRLLGRVGARWLFAAPWVGGPQVRQGMQPNLRLPR